MSQEFGNHMPAADLPIRSGEPVRLSGRLWRLTCGNAGVMTGPGTNSYLIDAADGWTLIDPGPMDADHLRGLRALAAAPIRRILVTHTHPDHSPGAAALRQQTGAKLLGRPSAHARGQDTTFVPDRELADGERIELGPDMTLRVIHTPGHASNHLCYLLEPQQVLFTGDHIIQGSRGWQARAFGAERQSISRARRTSGATPVAVSLSHASNATEPPSPGAKIARRL